MLYKTNIFHQRITPNQKFNYTIPWVALKLDDLPHHLLISYNKFNLFSIFWDKYGTKKSKHSKDIEKEMIDYWLYIGVKTESFTLFTTPAILGSVFNPVSFWFSFDNKKNLVGIVVEVNNTFKEKHFYYLANNCPVPIDAIKTPLVFTKEKIFHVSPFMPREGKYEFKFIFEPNKIKIFIDYFIEENLILKTGLIAIEESMTYFNILKWVIKTPFLGILVLMYIHYHAIKKYLSGLKYYHKPQQLKNIS